MPDAAEYGDAGSHTLGNIYARVGELNLPHLYSLGLGNIKDARLPNVVKPLASFGRLATKTRAKDTTSGHWELAGLIMEPPFATFTSFPVKLLDEWLSLAHAAGLWKLSSDKRMVWQGTYAYDRIPAQEPITARYLANRPASGTQIIDELGEEHVKTGAPIVYTSADSVFQVAAHEDIIPIETQYKLCKIAREVLTGINLVGRVIARPFIGEPGSFTRTKNRRDYSWPPVSATILDALHASGKHTLGIGKVDDIFCNQGILFSNHTTNNTDGINATIEALKFNNEAAIIFTNLVDFDMAYGHRNDPHGYAKALEYFDTRMPEIFEALRPEDLLIITADHGCDPTTAHTDHTREYVPILAYGGKAIDLGTRSSLADVAATIYEALGHGTWAVGESFYPSL